MTAGGECCSYHQITFSGSNGLGTLLTVTGTGFSSENASIFVGKARCHVEEISGKWKKFGDMNTANLAVKMNQLFIFLRDFVNCIPATSQVCRLGSASAGTYPVMVSFPSLGNSRYPDGDMFHFTYQLIVSSLSPLSGSVAGETQTQKQNTFLWNSPVIWCNGNLTMCTVSENILLNFMTV